MSVEQSHHCPNLGLKQNRAIRFASPSPEHRCYVTGDAQDIPVDQAGYCLSQGHVNCPLYMGLEPSSTTDLPVTFAPESGASAGLQGWFRGLSPRDRAIYAMLLTLLLVIVGIYAAVGIQLFSSDRAGGGNVNGAGGIPAVETSTATMTMTVTATAPATDTSTATPSASATATTTATSTETPETDTTATTLPTATAAIVAPPVLPPQPTDVLLPPPILPSNTPLPIIPIDPPPAGPTDPPLPPPASATSTQAPYVPPEAPSATTVAPQPTSPPAPGPSATVAAPPPTDAPGQPPAEPPVTPSFPTGTPGNRAPDSAETTDDNALQQWFTLYFADAMTNTLLVAVTRLAPVRPQRDAVVAVEELLAGPTGDLMPVLRSDARLLPDGVRRQQQTVIVNFERYPFWEWDTAGYGMNALALTLTELPNIREVQIQVNGEVIGIGSNRAELRRPVLNPHNPQDLPASYDSGTRFLPLYFIQDGRYVRITRLVRRTPQVARATVVELLRGPGTLEDQVTSPIPLGTRLIDIRKQEDRAVVNLTTPFADAENQQAAQEVLVLSLTELRDSGGERVFTYVEILVEGQPLADLWGAEYDRVFTRPLLNPE